MKNALLLPIALVVCMHSIAFAADNPEPCIIAHETLFKADPDNRQRLKIGVCEQVRLKAPGVAQWTITGTPGYILNAQVAQTVIYTAPKIAGNNIISATLNGRVCQVEFTIITPVGVTMTASANYYHEQGFPSSGFTGRNIVLSPADVSFRGIKVQEGFVPTGSGTGVFSSLNGQQHPLGAELNVIDGNIVDSNGDLVFTKGSTAPVNGDYTGAYTLNIPWLYHCTQGGQGIPLFPVLHSATSNAAGQTTTDKANANKTFPLNAPSVSF